MSPARSHAGLVCVAGVLSLAAGCLRLNPGFQSSASDGEAGSGSDGASSSGDASSGDGVGSSGGASSGPGPTTGEPSDWWDPDWKCRRRLPIAGHSEESFAGRFPVMIRLSPDNFDMMQAQPDGSDLRFVDAGQQVLPHEIERWDDTSTIWLGLPALPSEGADVWMYWCGPAAQPAGGVKVWDGFEAVFHLADALDGELVRDSTGAHHASARGGMSAESRVASPWGFALRFDGVDDFVTLDMGSPLETDGWTALTVEAWAKQTTPGEQRIFCKSPGPSSAEHTFAAGLHSDNDDPYIRVGVDGPEGFVDQTTSNFSVTQGEWFHVVVTWSAADARAVLFIDGKTSHAVELVGTDLRDNSTRMAIGNINDLGLDKRFWTGEIDEVRVHRVRRSDRWIEHQVASMRAGIVDYGQPDEAL